MRLRLAALPLVFLAACAPQVLTQPVPVSTDPPGAALYVDGKSACLTPCKPELERNQDHILTLRLDGYRQKDVIIKRQYQSAKVMLNAINDGARQADFFKDARWGLGGGVQSVNRQEDTGEAYVLTPSAVSVRLVPTAGFPVLSPPQAAPAPAQASGQPGAQPVVGMASLLRRMAPDDEHMLENALETSRSGEPTVWTNPESMTGFSVVPEPATITGSGLVVRWFTLAVRQGGRTDVGHAPAHRVGRGEWSVDLADFGPARPAEGGPAPSGQVQAASPPVLMGGGEASQGDTSKPDPGAEEITQAETMRALGQTAVPTAHKSWDMGSSGSTKTSTTYGQDGSVSTKTTTTRTSARASVGVGPGAAVSAIGALQDLLGGSR